MQKKPFDHIRAIVVDDESESLEFISRTASDCDFIRVTGKFQNPQKALESLDFVTPDIAMVDIEMPCMDGFELAERILQKSPMTRIIFISGWNQYAVKAFEINALDYLLKPVNPSRFAVMAERVKDEIARRRQDEKLKISMFGRLEVSIGDKPVKWQRTKSAELFAFLLMNHGEYIHKETIAEALWPDYEPAKALIILQSSIYKIRQVFSAVARQVQLNYNASRYCLIVRGADCDYFEIEQAVFNYKSGDRDTFLLIEKACALYGNGFLNEQGYIWSLEKDEQIKNSLIRILKEIISAYSADNNIDARIRTLSLAAHMMPYDEEINYFLLKELIKRRNLYALHTHCAWLDAVLKDEYDAVPSPQLQKIIQKYK